MIFCGFLPRNVYLSIRKYLEQAYHIYLTYIKFCLISPATLFAKVLDKMQKSSILRKLFMKFCSYLKRALVSWFTTDLENDVFTIKMFLGGTNLLY